MDLSGLLCGAGLLMLCSLPLLITGGLFAYVRFSNGSGVQASSESGIPIVRRGLVDRLLLPDPIHAHRRYDDLIVANPGVSREELLRRVARRTMFECGFIGFVAGLPGLPLLPLTAPADFITAGRMQAALVQMIAHAYGRSLGDGDPALAARQTYLIVYGGAETLRGVAQFVARILLKPAFESLPILGGIVGFAANYLLTQMIATVAIRHYSGTLDTRSLAVDLFSGAERLKGQVQQAREEARLRAANQAAAAPAIAAFPHTIAVEAPAVAAPAEPTGPSSGPDDHNQRG